MTGHEEPTMSVVDYTALSDDYDARRYEKPADRFVETMRQSLLLDLLDLDEQMHVADVASGTGRGALLLAERVWKVTAMDATAAMLDRAREKAGRRGIGNIEFVQADAFALPCPDDSFDAVISLNFLHLFHDRAQQRRLVAEMLRIVKPGGQVVIELDNALHGGPLGICRKYFGRDIGYNWPWEIGRLFGDGAEVERIGGANLPGLWRLHRAAPALVDRCEGAIRFGPMRWLTRRLMVAARKTVAN